MNDTPQTIAFNAEVVRAFLFTQAQEVAAGMADSKAVGAEAALITGAVEFAVQLWMQVAVKSGVPIKEAREKLEKQVRLFAFKHAVLRLDEAQELPS